MAMDGTQIVIDSSEPVSSAVNLDSIALLTSLSGSSVDLVPSSGGESTLSFSLTSLPVALAGNLNSMAKDQRDLAVSGPDLSLVAQNTLETLVRITDGNFTMQTADPLKSDSLTKQAFDEKGLSPLNLLNSSAFTDTGHASPAPGLQFRSAGNGGDTMLSAINYTDNEMLTDSAFDINNSAPPGLGHLDDNLFSGLGNPSSSLQGQGGNAFDLFDSSVNDPLSPFGDGLPIDTSSLPTIENERNTDSMMDEAKPAQKSNSTGNKKTQQQQQQQSPAQSQSGMGSPGKSSVQCPICCKQFNNVSALAKHRLTHSDVRKYLCTVCNKGFKRQDHLNGHQMTHLDKKPFGCPLENCDKGYCDARSLRRHLEAHHHLPTEVAQTHVLTSMAASGISPPAQRNGKGKTSDAASLAAAVKATQAAAAAASAAEGGAGLSQSMSSPSYSANSSPSPSQGSGSNQNQFFHFEVQPSKVGTTGGSVAVKLDTEAGDLGLGKLQEVALQHHKNMLQTGAVASGEQGQQPQFQVQFQLQQAPADLLAVVQAQQLQILQQQQQQQQQQQVLQAQQQQGVEVKGSGNKKNKAAVDEDTKVNILELSPQTSEGAGIDSGVSLHSDASWQDRAQVYNFVGTPGSGEQSPASLSGDLSPAMVPHVSPSPSPGAATPTSPLHNTQHRLQWLSAPHSPQKKKDKDNDKGEGPVQCSVCERRFKTLPALNGHMRLHGGYLKKDGEGKRSGSKKSTSTSSSSSTSSPSTPTDMGPPPPPPRPQHPPHATQHSPLPPCSPQAQQPSSPSVQVPAGLAAASTTPLASPQPATPTALGDLPAGLQTFYLTGGQAVQVGINQVPAEVVQQQFLQQQLELQKMEIKLKEAQAIRNLEEQLKQNIHEQQLISITPAAPAPASTTSAQLQASPTVSVAQANEALMDVTQTMSPLRAASPQKKEHIKKLVDSFQQVEELHRQKQQQKLALLPQLSAQQIEQIQQQHSQIGLPPLQPLQLQQLLQDQLQQQQQQQQLLQQQQSLEGLQLGQGQLLLQSQPPAQLSNGGNTQNNVAMLNSLTVSSTSSNAVPQVNTMTPGLPGGVLSNGQQLQIGSGTMVSLPMSTTASVSSIVQQTSAPVLAASQQTSSVETVVPSVPLTVSPSEHFLGLSQQQLVVSAPLSVTESVVQHQLGIPTVQTMALGESVDIQDPAVSQLMENMSDFEGGMGSDLMHMSNPHGGGLGDILSGGVLGQQGGVEKLSGFQSSQSLMSTESGLPSSTHIGLDSIKQDVMLSSAIHSSPLVLGIGDQASDRLLSSLDEVSHASAIKTCNSEIKRRLSADLESSRKSLSSSSLTITSLLNKGPAFAGHFPKKSGDSGGNIIPPPTGRVRMRSKSGDVHKLMRSKSVDNSLIRQRSNTEESIYRARKRSGDETFIGRSKSQGEDYLSQSDGAGVFRNPGSLPSPFKIKRKHRPTPLFIPPTLSSFQSRLRSPRLWDGGEGKGKGHTPPPYTPPPMLSPIRSGSGLFWSMHGARPLTPQSAPVSARLSLSRRGSIAADSMDVGVKEGDEESPPPETDIKPHVNIGSQYQADLPPCIGQRQEAVLTTSKEDLMWEPSAMGRLSDEDVQNYQDFACCAAVKGNGSNVEYALHLLYLAKGDIQTAMLMLMGDPPVLPAGHGLLTYKYQESESWSGAEIQAFHEALIEFDKDFFNVAGKISTKSVKECIQFYYLWKKVCPDDYKRLRTLRRKRHQNTLYNLRSQQPTSGGEPTPPPQGAGGVPGQEEYDYDGSDSETEDQTGTNGMATAEHMQVDMMIETDMSSVASSPAAPPSHPMVADLNPLTMVARNSVGGLVPAPLGLQPSPSPVMTTMAASLPSIQQCPTPPQPAPTFACEFPGCNTVLTTKQSLMRHMRKHQKEKEGSGVMHTTTAHPKPRPSTPSRSPVYDQNGEEIFPCKLCDRVFSKVKSRSAHMKSHKVAEPDKKVSAVSAALLSSAVSSPMSDS